VRPLRPVLLMLAAAIGIATPALGRDLRVMSVNVRVPVDADGANRWEARRDLFAATVARADPDVIGTQELHQRQGDDILRRLPRYNWFGRDRRGGHADEHMGIFYRRDRLTLIDQGDFWLSDTPAVPGSISWGHPYPRMVTWGRFRDAQGRRVVLLDTHFPYRAGDEDARAKAAALIMTRIESIAGGDPVILTGDFNTVPGSETHRVLTQGLTDARLSTEKPSGPAATFHNFTGTPDRRIDWILVRGFGVDAFTTDTAHDGQRYPSDHFPIITDLSRNAPTRQGVTPSVTAIGGAVR
jgi:endonuclease/exonuclease/phosphatase family metal-dependent hydrolase